MKRVIYVVDNHALTKLAKAYEGKYFSVIKYKDNLDLFLKSLKQSSNSMLCLYSPSFIAPLIFFLLRFRRIECFYFLHEPKLNLKRSSFIKLSLINVWTFLCSLNAQFIFLSKHSYNLARKNVFISKSSISRKIISSLVLRKQAESKEISKLKYDFIIWGLLSKDKGLDFFLKLAKKLPEKEFGILGRKSKESSDILKGYSLKNLSFKLEEKFIEESDIEDFILSGKIVLLPQSDASQSGCLPMALRYGKPVVCFDVGSFSEYIKNNEFGGRICKKDGSNQKDELLEFVNLIDEIENDYNNHRNGAFNLFYRHFDSERAAITLSKSLSVKQL